MDILSFGSPVVFCIILIVWAVLSLLTDPHGEYAEEKQKELDKLQEESRKIIKG